MEPIEKGLKIADGKITGEKPIFVKTEEGFGSGSVSRKFKINFEDDKVRRGVNTDLLVYNGGGSGLRQNTQDRANTLAKIKSMRVTAGSV